MGWSPTTVLRGQVDDVYTAKCRCRRGTNVFDPHAKWHAAQLAVAEAGEGPALLDILHVITEDEMKFKRSCTTKITIYRSC